RVDVAGRRRVAGRVHLVRVAGLAHPLPEVARAARAELRVALPDDLQLRGRLDGRVLLRRRDGDEVADLHDLGALDVRDRLLVDRDRVVVLGGDRPGAARVDPAGVPHAGDADVLDVGVVAFDLGRNVDARVDGADELVVLHR